VTRQTLWRWRRQGKIPKGSLYRGKDLVFTLEEASDIRRYANRLEPTPLQLGLFNGRLHDEDAPALQAAERAAQDYGATEATARTKGRQG
jgi:hypothetical protein